MPMPTSIQGMVRRVPLIDRLVSTTPNGDLSLSPQGDMKNLSIFNGLQGAAVDRAYFTGTIEGTRNSGVTLTSATATSYSSTNALLVVANTNSGPNAPDVIMDSFAVKVDTIAGGAPTFWYWYHALDKNNRGLIAGTGSATLVNMQNCEGSGAPGVQVYCGALTAQAATNDVRDLGSNCVCNGASVANAIHQVKYGRLEGQASGTFTIPTTGVALSTFDAPAVVIPPGCVYVLNELWTGRTTTGLVGEVAISLIVR